jgi:hypothetical protein
MESGPQGSLLMIAAAGIYYDHVTTRLDHEGMKTHLEPTVSRQLPWIKLALARGQHIGGQVGEEVPGCGVRTLKVHHPLDCKCT